ncbi:MAG: SagB/ThcOx family dehydrogenase [Pseudomonadota bacterium]
MPTPLDTVLAYHERTKHHFQRYAAGPGGLDWATQPDPFRSFADSPQLALPLLGETSLQTRYANLYQPGATAPHAFTLANIAALLELAFGLSAWKEYGATRWALRCNPSSGNLHPTEAYVVVQGTDGIADGVHHYLSRDHVLEQRCDLATDLPAESFLLGLSSIHWREAWKYGERAYRYCQHDAGHAIAATRYAAAALGWQARVLGDWSDADIVALLGLDRDADFGDAEREHPDVMMLIGCKVAEPLAPQRAVPQVWYGHANCLSPHHAHDWPVIEAVAAACTKPETHAPSWPAPHQPEPLPLASETRASEIIKQRRSAQEFDGVTSISADTLYRMLDLTLPRAAVAPWDAIDWAPRIHLALFVHRVDGLAPGVYLFLRNALIESKMRADLSDEFQWVRAENCPAHLQLYRVAEADARNAAKALSCHQDIAADGAFSLGMLAEYESNLAHGPWIYRQLFWEAGILGQMLYLEAEAADVRGTGIGCYFDDGVHEVLGIKGRWLQSLYHFTIGGALTDTRLETLSAYAHLKRE